jgi:hypothetical protein
MDADQIAPARPSGPRVIAPSPHAGQIGVALLVATIACIVVGTYVLIAAHSSVAPQSPAAVRQVFVTYEAAMYAGDGARMCGMLTRDSQALMANLGQNANLGASCEKTATAAVLAVREAAASSPVAQQKWYTATHTAPGAVTFSDGGRHATFDVPNGDGIPGSAISVDGQWRLDLMTQARAFAGGQGLAG